MNSPRNEVRDATLGCIALVILVPLAIVGIMALGSLLLMWAWSTFVTPIFGLTLLSFQQSFAAITVMFILRVFMFNTFGYNRKAGKRS
jgi:hypothetical protein